MSDSDDEHLACATCGALDPVGRCGACKSAAYCNVNCQKAHFDVHMFECMHLAGRFDGPAYDDADADTKKAFFAFRRSLETKIDNLIRENKDVPESFISIGTDGKQQWAIGRDDTGSPITNFLSQDGNNRRLMRAIMDMYKQFNKSLEYDDELEEAVQNAVNALADEWKGPETDDRAKEAIQKNNSFAQFLWRIAPEAVRKQLVSSSNAQPAQKRALEPDLAPATTMPPLVEVVQPPAKRPRTTKTAPTSTDLPKFVEEAMNKDYSDLDSDWQKFKNFLPLVAINDVMDLDL